MDTPHAVLHPVRSEHNRLGLSTVVFLLHLRATGEDKWTEAYLFWVKASALSFAMGVASGITMLFQFGTHWPGFMETVGKTAGPLLAYEVMTASFLEALFLGLMLFDFSRAPSGLHSLATFLVAFAKDARLYDLQGRSVRIGLRASTPSTTDSIRAL